MTISTPVPLTGAFSEWQNDEGRTRPHYAGIAQAAQLLGPDGLSERWSDAQRQVDLDAFTFYLDPGKYRPTPVDWIPRHTSRPMAGDLTGRRPAYHGDQPVPR